jgi:hypothetical protein
MVHLITIQNNIPYSTSSSAITPTDAAFCATIRWKRKAQNNHSISSQEEKHEMFLPYDKHKAFKQPTQQRPQLP